VAVGGQGTLKAMIGAHTVFCMIVKMVMYLLSFLQVTK